MPTTTAQARRTRKRAEYNAFLAECPSRQLLDRLSDKWMGLVIQSLSEGPRRYSEIARDIAGVSQKMLTQTLRSLERDGLAERTVTPSVPVRVDYRLTELGRSLLPVMRAVTEWAEQHMDDVRAARDDFDDRTARSA
jgi:DNA-binding HxlR family transcriptional regulator